MATLHESREYRLRRTAARVRTSFEFPDLDALRRPSGRLNVADGLTKRNVQLCRIVNDLMSTGLWNVDTRQAPSTSTPQIGLDTALIEVWGCGFLSTSPTAPWPFDVTRGSTRCVHGSSCVSGLPVGHDASMQGRRHDGVNNAQLALGPSCDHLESAR